MQIMKDIIGWLWSPLEILHVSLIWHAYIIVELHVSIFLLYILLMIKIAINTSTFYFQLHVAIRTSTLS